VLSDLKEYETKVEKLQAELDGASALCAKQAREIRSLKNDNEKLKEAEREKIKIEAEYRALSDNSLSLERRIKEYESDKKSHSSIAQAKIVALRAEVERVNKEKERLQIHLDEMQDKISRMEAGKRKIRSEMGEVKKRLADNDALIKKIKTEVIKLNEPAVVASSPAKEKPAEIKEQEFDPYAPSSPYIAGAVDHSVPDRIVRIRAATSYDNDSPDNFLKRTQSVLYRIRWSLFKDDK
jgi:chromosome segregation ATPase